MCGSGYETHTKKCFFFFFMRRNKFLNFRSFIDFSIDKTPLISFLYSSFFSLSSLQFVCRVWCGTAYSNLLHFSSIFSNILKEFLFSIVSSNTQHNHLFLRLFVYVYLLLSFILHSTLKMCENIFTSLQLTHMNDSKP